MHSPSTMAEFAEHYRLRVRRDACGDLVAPAKFGHLYAHTAGLIGLVLEDARNGQSRGRSLLARRRKALAAGLRLHQAGETEAILLFELNNPAHEKIAIKLVGAKRRRIPSPAQLATLRRAREAPRFAEPLRRARFRAQERTTSAIRGVNADQLAMGSEPSGWT